MQPHQDTLTDHLERQLPIEVQAVGDDLVVCAVHGDVDLHEAGQLRAVLNDACTGPHSTLQVDLADVRFMGSSGIGVLLDVSHRMAEDGRRVEVLDSPTALREAFEMVGVGKILDLDA